MTAGRANIAPADVNMMAQVTRIKGQNAELWAPLDESKLPNAKNLEPHFVQRYAGQPGGAIGAVSWYITLVTNTDVYPEPPTSWKALWDPANEGRLGLLALVSNSFLLEITAKTWFGGTEILDTEEGILQVLDKLAEVKPNVALWYRDEGQFQQALQAGEIPMGQYYHDVTGLAAAEGQPVRSTFPEEGGVLELRLLVRGEGLAGAGGGARVHRLHVPSRRAGQAVAQRRHGADRQARPARPHRRGVRGGRERHPADHPALRPLRRAGRLAEPEVDRDDRGLSARLARGQGSACRRLAPDHDRSGLTARARARGGDVMALRIEHVSKSFGNFQALIDVDLEFPHGKFICLLGPSGCGKTTLLRCIAGLEAPTTGRILLDGQDLTRAPAHKRGFGMVFQSLALFPHLTVGENVAYGLSQGRRSGAAPQAGPRSCSTWSASRA